MLETVSFFLVAYAGGSVARIPDSARAEVAEARWLRLDRAPGALAYRGEREVARRALDRLAEDEDV